MARRPDADVVVVGGGPAGSTVAWKLAAAGIHVIVLERAVFPREKVCGDYVEPRGLRVLDAMGSLSRLEETNPLPVTHTATHVESTCAFRGAVPFYGVVEGLARHGYVVPREVLDAEMLAAAERAGAVVHEGTSVTSLRVDASGVEIEAGHGPKAKRYRGKLVVGADGTNSIVARAANLTVEDPRHIAVAQRAYATLGDVDDIAEASFFFAEDMFPGYGWMFPMRGGRVNVGVGILAETRSRLRVHVPDLFAEFIERLRRTHPQCAQLELCAPPIGGIVKTYGGHSRNHFERGLLIGDAGCFVDPMTGDGITPAMESALLAASVIEAALESDRFDAAQLSGYDRSFRAYFDPSMNFVDLCAAMLRNRHLAGPWLRTLERGCRSAQRDESFARVASGYFGGPDIRPSGILGALWLWIVSDVAGVWSSAFAADGGGPTLSDLVEWQAALARSAVRDPLWHMRWALDVQRKWATVLADAPLRREDPRAAGLV
jgi:geranylgeranyl reductase family protein